jgi:hypothetical protein
MLRVDPDERDGVDFGGGGSSAEGGMEGEGEGIGHENQTKAPTEGVRPARKEKRTEARPHQIGSSYLF